MASLDASLRKEAVELDDDEELASREASRQGEPKTFSTLNFDGQIFADFQDFSGATFTGQVSLNNTRFDKGVSFAGAKFFGPVRLKGVTVPSARGNKITFAGASFFHSFSVRRSTLYLADFTGVSFGKVVSFRGCRFYASAKFDGSLFASAAAFENVVFHGAGNFVAAEFKGGLAFEKVTFRYSISHARFADAKFSEHAAFGGTRFGGNAFFTEAVFDAGASFDGAEFSFVTDGDPDGDNADASARETADLVVSFERATFRADLDSEVVSFRQARIGDRSLRRLLSFRGAHFQPNKLALNTTQRLSADFKDLECFGNLVFRDADLHHAVVADFSQARVGADTDFAGAHFGGDALFEKSHFGGDFLVSQARFDRYPDFKQATFFHFPELSQALLPSRKSSWSALERKNIVQRLTVLRRLASRTDDKKTEFDLLVRELKLEGGFASSLYGLVSSYGQSWLRPALWLVAFAVCVFPALYFATGKVRVSFENGVPAVSTNVTGECGGQDQGSAILAAVELSVRNALIVGIQDDQRAERLGECLGFGSNADARRLLAVLLQATQTVLTVLLVFLIGQAVRRRLQMR
jgi:uncharacterized protein YjbI with pentapeptide repeats